MARIVRGADGREWILYRRLMWRRPATVDSFENDLAAGYTSVTVLFGLLIVLFVVLFAWMPPKVVVPSWLLVPVAVVVFLLLLEWAVKRPWSVVAETDEDPNDERPPEHWVGTVNGILRARQEMTRTARDIQVYSVPDLEGALRPVD